MIPPADYGTETLNAAVALLVSYGTLAGDAVERNRSDVIPAGDMPRIVVTGDQDERFQGISPPQFEARLSILLECYAENASRDGLTAQLDIMTAQVKDALLCNAGFVARFTRFEDVKVRWKANAQGERYEGLAQIVIVAIWREIYRPRTPDDLRTITLGPSEAAGGVQVPSITIDIPADDPVAVASGSPS